MGWLDWFRKRPAPTRINLMSVTVTNDVGDPLGLPVAGTFRPNGFPLAEVRAKDFQTLVFKTTAPIGTLGELEILVDGESRYKNIVSLAWTRDVRIAPHPVPVTPPTPPDVIIPGRTARPGIVRPVGQALVDDAGPFDPFDTSLFWVLREGGDSARVRQNYECAADLGYDGVRIFYAVNWPGDSRVVGRPDTLERALITMHRDYGLRAIITVQDGDAMEVADVVKRHRDKVIMLEPINEQNGTEEQAIRMTGILMATGLPVCVGFGDLRGDVHGAELEPLKDLTRRAGANAINLHTERSTDYARNQRQGWDFRLLNQWVKRSGEPIGIGSSGAQTTDPQLLADMRAVGTICGVASYNNHTGAGITGIQHHHPVGGFRPANLWEQPAFEAVSRAMRNTDRAIGHTGIANWSRDHGSKWVEIDGPHEKNYAARLGKESVHFITDVRGPIAARPIDPVVWTKFFNPATGAEVDPTTAGLRGYVMRVLFQ